MPVTDGREYRSFDLMKPVGSDERSAYTVEGYATTFDRPYDIGFGMSEVIKSTALVGADMSDVIFQMNHQGIVMARMRNGTLRVEADDHGLKVTADLSGTSEGRNLYEAIVNGLMDRMSWGFVVANDGWEYDEATRTSYITKIEKVFDVSAVSIPANEGTEIHARSYIDGVIEAERRESAQRERKCKESRGRISVLLGAIKGE